MSKPGKSLRNMCKKLGVRLTVKRGKKRVYKSIKVLKGQCVKKKKKRKVKRRRRRRKFGASLVGDDESKDDNNNSTDIDIDSLVSMLNDLGIIAEKDDKNVNLIRIRSNTNKNKSYVLDTLNKFCECPGCRFSLTCSHLKSLFPGDPEVQEQYDAGRQWASHFKKEHGRPPINSDRDPRTLTRLNNFLDWYNNIKGIDTTQIKINEQGSSKKTRQFGRKKIKRKRNKMKKEKISSSLKKLCKKHGVRLTVKRGKKRVYKSVKVLKGQCKRKTSKKKKVKRRRRRRKFGASLVSYSSGDEEYDYSYDEEEQEAFEKKEKEREAAITLQTEIINEIARRQQKKYDSMSMIQKLGYDRNKDRLARQEKEQAKEQEAVLKKVMKEEVARREAARREAENKEKLKNKLENDLRNLSVNNGIVDNGIIIRPLWSLYGQVKDLTKNLSMTETTIEHFVNNIVQRKTEEEARALVKKITDDVNKWKRGDLPISELNLGAYNFGRRKRKKKKRKVKRKRKKKKRKVKRKRKRKRKRRK